MEAPASALPVFVADPATVASVESGRMSVAEAASAPSFMACGLWFRRQVARVVTPPVLRPAYFYTYGSRVTCPRAIDLAIQSSLIFHGSGTIAGTANRNPGSGLVRSTNIKSVATKTFKNRHRVHVRSVVDLHIPPEDQGSLVIGVVPDFHALDEESSSCVESVDRQTVHCIANTEPFA